MDSDISCGTCIYWFSGDQTCRRCSPNILIFNKISEGAEIFQRLADWGFPAIDRTQFCGQWIGKTGEIFEDRVFEKDGEENV